ncbi:MAG TPA: hypothetical protein VGN36_07475, partial [Sphingorhabdus sp.]|nr:hypothetical protein [Sphingorhabdus sp.]
PFTSSSRSLADNIFAEIGGISVRNSLNRRGPARKCHMTFAAHRPDNTDMQMVSAHGSWTMGLRFFLTFNMRSNFPNWRFPKSNRVSLR